MKVSRFEPHILAPLADHNDLDVFMKELEEESEHLSATQTSAEVSDREGNGQDFSGKDEANNEEIKRGLNRLVEALGHRSVEQGGQAPRIFGANNSRKNSKKAMALHRYETQKSFDINNFTHYSKIS